MSNNESEGSVDLIERREFRKRYKEYMKHSAEFMSKAATIAAEGVVSFGTIIERNAEQYANKVAIRFEDKELTYKEYNEIANQYAHYFLSLGLKKGDIVDVLMKNRIEMLIIIGAVGKIGVVGSMINSDLREKSLIHSFKTTLGKVIIIGEGCLDSFEKVKNEIALSEDHVLCFSIDRGNKPIPKGYVDLSKIVKDFPIDNPTTTSEIKTFDNHLFIFTSGTTGLPKAAYFPHHRMVVAGITMGQAVGHLTSDDTIYVSTPLFHSNGLGIGVGSAFATGGTLVIARKFSANRFWDDIRKYNATAFNYVGELCRYLLNQPPKPNDLDNSVRTILGNGLRPEIWMEFKKRFGIERVAEIYGTTESYGGFINILNFDCTCGYSARTYAIVKYDIEEDEVVRNENGFMQKVKLGGTGLLLFPVVGDITYFGYTDEKSTKAKIFYNVFKEGDTWINSGDLVRDQGCRHIMFVDRLGDTFRWKGHNVSTTEVENILNNFKQISLSSVYGVKIPGTDGRAGLASFAVETNIEDFDFKGLAEYLLENLPSYAVPIFLRIKSTLLTTSTFKVKKILLKKEGFDIGSINDALYVMLPHESNYVPLTKQIHEDIQQGKINL